MNDMIEPGTALMVLPVASLPTILAADDKDILGKLARELAGYEPDASTPAGRTRINSVKKTIGTAKMDFCRLADTLMEDAKKTIDGVRSERKIIEERMDAMRDQIGQPLAEYQTREKARTDAHEAALQDIIALAATVTREMSSEQIAERLEALSALHANRVWEEFGTRAQKARSDMGGAPRVAYDIANSQEEQAAELAQLRAAEAERQRLEAIEAQQAREKRIATEAAEAARVAAEQKAARDAREVEERAQAALQAAEALRVHQAAEAERRQREAAEALARAEGDRLAAEQKAKAETDAAIEAERARVAREAAARKADDEKRAADTAHRRWINREAALDLVQRIQLEEPLALEAGRSFPEALARAVITLIAKGEVRHITITY